MSILIHKSYFRSAESSLFGLRSCELISCGLLNKDRQPCPTLLEETPNLSREVRRTTRNREAPDVLDRLRIMRSFRIDSVDSPFDEPGLASRTAAALSRADAMGLLCERVACLDYSALEQLRSGMAEAGIGEVFIAELEQSRTCEPARLSTLVTKIIDALEQSPAPRYEWPALVEVLGLDLLVRLLGISESSARRYLSGERVTPDPVAARLHFVALVVGDLAGAYNDIGVRRWFDRPRSRLNGAAPAEVLGEEWSPDDPTVLGVRELASALVSSPAT